ncbi:SCO1664 family protein [Streptomyces sp. NPDC048441]|uniref:SCO1664 family protein n=1 Tax=Streptomyces sp. NPDC048441 TaxID=3365552 RepID=UPI003711A261
MPAAERIQAGRVSSTGVDAVSDVMELLTRGELTVRGRIREASNAVLYCSVSYEGRAAACVYKPVAGERPLWDFPDGTLAQREVAAYEVSEALGWGLVPPTVLRDGPHGEGMCQLWIGGGPEPGSGSEGGEELLALVEGAEPGEGWKAIGFADVGEGRTALLVHADDERLRRLSVLDAVINNADRKGGHLLTDDGRLYGIDHGVTFNAEDKLRTLLWGWAGESLTAEAVGVLEALRDGLVRGAPLALRLGKLITGAEVDALRARVEALLSSGKHPVPSGDWPAIPWPPV